MHCDNKTKSFFMQPKSCTGIIKRSRAADWNLAEPTWIGRLRLISKNEECYIKLEDKATGELYAKCPIEIYPGPSIESVSDSSRYFVLRIQDDTGRSAFIGIGFGDRSDSFDLNVALQDHFKWKNKEKQITNEPNQPELDLKFKEGETIKINMKITKKDGTEATTPKGKLRTTAGLGLLPPPPGSTNRLPAPPGSSPASSPAHVPKSNTSNDSWTEFTSAPTKHLFTNLKTPIKHDNQSNVVYKLDCKDCNKCYIGQTKQYLKKRIYNHQYTATHNVTAETALSKHSKDRRHNFDFQNTKILKKENNYKKRLIYEMIYIKKDENAVNFRTDIDNLSVIYNNLIHA
ncbi:atp-binding cassette abc transporter-related [Holotrichia oblita]|uniref:Atp-binding cassette abc transporter-related n=1 Tax=Holotrichia oblita TaxID=644536 RepID=A0ACB9T3T2_HOLOL|nr:atp-binding cassette abc transporter-related [Holotrichia oblita]